MRRHNVCIGPKNGSGTPTVAEAMFAVKHIVLLMISVEKEAGGINNKRNQLAAAAEAVGKLNTFFTFKIKIDFFSILS